MNIIGLLFFSFGILLILFGISIFTPFFSWFGRKLNSSNFSSVNYNQTNSIRNASLFIGICFFIFGIFIAIASATLLNVWSTQNTNLQKPPIIFSNPMQPGTKISPTPGKHNENTSITSEYKLKCPLDKDGLNMRQKANLDAQIIMLIPCNAVGIQDRKERYSENGVEWFLVEYQNNTGWVVGKYLEIQAINPHKTTFHSKLIAKKRP